MTYKETLAKAKQYDIDSLKLRVAVELSNACDNYNQKLTDDQFERACDYLCDCCSSTDYASVWLICSAFVSSLDENNDVEQALAKDYYDFTEWVTNNYNAWS